MGNRLSTSYTYDANGNQLTAGTRTFTYDLANRLKTTKLGSTTTTYTYDGDGVRLQASTGTSAANKTNFVWDLNQGLPQVALERNGSNTLLRQYIYGLKRIRQTVGTASYYHTDQLGSVTNTTSASGASQRTWSYEPYGVIRTSTGSSPASFVNFTGEYLDPTGLYHLRARQYDPVSGRFTRTDPVENSANGSQYAYVAGRPTVMVDPSGTTLRPANSSTRVLQAASPVQSGAQPRETWKSIPRWKNLGIFYGGLFIQRPDLCPFGRDVPMYPCLLGDGRGFSAHAARSRYRMYMGFDFTAGLAYFRINPTCELSSGKCHRPHEIEGSSIWDWHLFGSDRANYIDKRVGRSSVGFRWKAINSGIGFPLQGDPSNPEINGGITFGRNGGVGVDLDGFPSFELYHRVGASGSPSCVYRFGETTPFALMLPAIVPGTDEGKSHC